jgi:hypothetical protein
MRQYVVSVVVYFLFLTVVVLPVGLASRHTESHALLGVIVVCFTLVFGAAATNKGVQRMVSQLAATNDEPSDGITFAAWTTASLLWLLLYSSAF